MSALVAAAVLTVGAVLAIHSAGQATAAGAAAVNPNCTLVVPADPLSAQGLATPYQLVATDPAGGPCNEANAGQSAFVEAAIITADGQLSTYDPLVIDKGTQPAAPTVPATVPAGATVGIWFGFNGTLLTLQSANGTDALNQGNCVNGLPGGTIFGQFSYCDAPAFFQAANTAIGNGMLAVPAAGTAKDGQPCPTLRDFSVVDQDQSDNVVTHYLANANGQTAQNNAANAAALKGAVDLANGSDNLLLTKFIDPALGCTPWTTPDQSSDNNPTAALATDELSAAANQQAPIALVPLNDPMTLNNNNASTTKTNLYRQGVDQGQIGGGGDNGDAATYCANLFTAKTGIQRVFNDQAMFALAPSVDAAMASNLFTFLAMRANQSFTNLGCQGLINMPNPIALTMNNNIVTAATFTLGGAQAPAPTTSAAATSTGTASAPAAPTTSAAPTSAPASNPSMPPAGPPGVGDPSSTGDMPTTGAPTTTGGHHHG